MKKILTLIITLTVFFSGCTISSVEDYYNSTEAKGDKAVSISINCQTAVDYPNSKRDNGKILGGCQVYVDENATVFDVLKEACKINKIQMDYEGSGNSVYVKGIDYLYEFDCGDLSGWQYSVNDKFYSVGCNSFIPQNGDTVRWIYTCDLGEDIGNHFGD